MKKLAALLRKLIARPASKQVGLISTSGSTTKYNTSSDMRLMSYGVENK